MGDGSITQWLIPSEGPMHRSPISARLLASGAAREDLSLIARRASYEAVFRVLYMLDDPGVDGDDNKMMHEELLGADPSGREGRPGTAPKNA
jgi:hypothetical protein